jgi:putative sigma-54 modulation protein
MKIVIKATGLQLTESLKTYINKKFLAIEKIIKSFETKGQLTLKIEVALTTRHHHKGNIFYVECTLPIEGKLIRIEQTDVNMHTAIDLAQGRLKEEVEKFKDKKISKNKKLLDKIRQKE